MKFLRLSKMANAVPDTVTRQIGMATMTTRKHSPGLLLGVGVVGMIATAVLASKSTLKLDEVLNKAEAEETRIKVAHETGVQDYTETKYKKDLIQVRVNLAGDLFKLYAPAVIIGAASVCALTGSHAILNRRAGALAAAYKVLDQGFREYRKRVIEDQGPEKDLEYRFGVEQREVAVDEEDGTVVETINVFKGASGYAEEFNAKTSHNFNESPNANTIFLQCQEEWANKVLRREGYLYLNDVWTLLGMERTAEGQVVGWVYDGEHDDRVDFGIFDRGTKQAMDFLTGKRNTVLIDPNVDGLIWEKLARKERKENRRRKKDRS